MIEYDDYDKYENQEELVIDFLSEQERGFKIGDEEFFVMPEADGGGFTIITGDNNENYVTYKNPQEFLDKHEVNGKNIKDWWQEIKLTDIPYTVLTSRRYDEV